MMDCRVFAMGSNYRPSKQCEALSLVTELLLFDLVDMDYYRITSENPKIEVVENLTSNLVYSPT